MTKEKEPAATDTAKDQEIRQFLDSEQPRQASQPESSVPDSS